MSKKVLIVGTGHSGTAFIARLLMELGGDFWQGDPPADWTLGAHAMEHPDIKATVESFSSAVWDHRIYGMDAALVGAALPLYREEMKRLFALWPQYVKAPLLGPTLSAWRTAGLEPSGIVIVYRRPEAVLDSIVRYNGGIYGPLGPLGPRQKALQRLRLLFATTLEQAIEANVPLSLVDFPRCVTTDPVAPDGIYWNLYQNLPEDGYPLHRFAEIHRRVASPDLVHHH